MAAIQKKIVKPEVASSEVATGVKLWWTPKMTNTCQKNATILGKDLVQLLFKQRKDGDHDDSRDNGAGIRRTGHRNEQEAQRLSLCGDPLRNALYICNRLGIGNFYKSGANRLFFIYQIIIE